MNNIPNCIKVMLDKPGLYIWEHNKRQVFMEIDARGKVYQLCPKTLKRDGILSSNGWLVEPTDGTFVPLSK